MEIVSQNLKDTVLLRSFGIFKIPLLAFTNPSVISSSSDHMEVRIPLNRWTRNHLRSMYFGALAIGADTAVGLLEKKKIRQSGMKISLVFKDFQADFLKRAEGHVHFFCKEGALIDEMISECLETKERVTRPIKGYAVVPSIETEPVAEFTLSLSLKLKE